MTSESNFTGLTEAGRNHRKGRFTMSPHTDDCSCLTCVCAPDMVEQKVFCFSSSRNAQQTGLGRFTHHQETLQETQGVITAPWKQSTKTIKYKYNTIRSMSPPPHSHRLWFFCVELLVIINICSIIYMQINCPLY